MTTIIVTGTPATGKTTVAKKLAEKTGFTYIDVNEIIDKEDLCEEYDEEKDCKVVDEDILAEKLVERADKEKDCVIDSHLSHFMPKEKVDLCIITICEMGELNKRLQERGYRKEKLEENILSEVMEVIKGECEEAGHDIKIIDTTADIDSQIDDIKIS